ncbi:ABC transporter substrate-binding protein [Betaproteobacteria bacterium]|nr:ABC transporter substrate-binding protein [Betaproteobacteria bacterium]
MMKKFSLTAVSLMVCATFALTGWTAGIQAQEKAVTLKAGIGSSLTGSSHGVGIVKFKEAIEKETNGRIKMQLFPDGQMGNDMSMMDSLKMGTLDMTVTSTGPIANTTKTFLVFDLPFLFTSEKIADTVLDGPACQEILDTLKGTGLVGLAYWENGFRNMTNSRKPINTPDDLKGLKIRTMQNPIHLDSFKKWGANPVPLPFNEVFTALEQKVIDGQENPNTLIYDAGFYEAQKYLTISRHFYTPFVLMIGQKSWDKLSPADQKLVQKIALDVRADQRAANREFSAKYVDLMRQKGIAINEISPTDIEKFKATSKEIYDQFANDIGKERLEKILAEVAKVK